MQTVLPSSHRGHANFGWLDSHHTFSFGEYYNPHRMGFRALRVINEDRIAGGSGFPTHSHRDMEIISYVVEGALAHQDTMGHTTVLRPGEVQKMSAGTGVSHSEFNALPDQDTHFLQIWILPDRQGYAPSYEQKSFIEDFKTKDLVLVASPDGEDGSLTLHQDIYMHIGRFRNGEERRIGIKPSRHAWIQLIKGEVTVNGIQLSTSDGFAVSGEPQLHIQSFSDSEFIIFDLA
jgi:hypothetical protein